MNSYTFIVYLSNGDKETFFVEAINTVYAYKKLFCIASFVEIENEIGDIRNIECFKN